MPEITIFAAVNNVGKVSDQAEVSVTDAAAASASVTIGKKGVDLQNTGTEECWFGGSTVDPANGRGIKLPPNAVITVRESTNDFQIYFKCATGLATTIGIVEYS